MFKVVGENIVVLDKKLSLEEGVHTVYTDASGNAYVDDAPDGAIEICEYEYSNGSLKVRRSVMNEGVPPKHAWFIGRSMWNNRRIHGGTLYRDFYTGDPVFGYLEGLPVDFNYTSFAVSTMALATYFWVGGRVCLGSGLILDQIDTNRQWYTAVGSGGCNTDWVSMFIALSALSIAIPLHPLSYEIGQEALTMVANQTSVSYFQYSHRRYTSMAINQRKMYSIGGYEIDSMAGLNDGSYSYTTGASLAMFNLTQ